MFSPFLLLWFSCTSTGNKDGNCPQLSPLKNWSFWNACAFLMTNGMLSLKEPVKNLRFQINISVSLPPSSSHPQYSAPLWPCLCLLCQPPLTAWISRHVRLIWSSRCNGWCDVLGCACRIRSFDFEEKGIQFDIPKVLALTDCAFRILFTKYDHHSVQCLSYKPRRKEKVPREYHHSVQCLSYKPRRKEKVPREYVKTHVSRNPPEVCLSLPRRKEKGPRMCVITRVNTSR